MIASLLMLAASAASATSIYGIALGQPLTMPECDIPAMTKNEIKLAAKGLGLSRLGAYKAPASGSCYKRTNDADAGTGTPVRPDEVVQVQFPYAERLAGNYGSSVAMKLLDGRVSYIRFETRGRTFQEEDAATFTAKFGTPSKVDPINLQNGFGAQSKAVRMTWQLSQGIVATYSSWAGDDGKGDFEVGTTMGRDAFWAPLRALLKPTKDL